MDASLLISVIGLMATFAQERRGQSESETQATIEDYKEWLQRGQHDIVIGILDSNHELLVATERFLRSGQQEILNRLDLLEESLAQSLISTAGWAEITQSLNPKARLSEQACSILQQFDECQASEVYADHDRGILKLYPLDGKYGQVPFKLPERRFVEADLDTLVGFGLLIKDWGTRCPRYKITREAIRLAQNSDEIRAGP